MWQLRLSQRRQARPKAWATPEGHQLDWRPLSHKGLLEQSANGTRATEELNLKFNVNLNPNSCSEWRPSVPERMIEGVLGPEGDNSLINAATASAYLAGQRVILPPRVGDDGALGRGPSAA